MNTEKICTKLTQNIKTVISGKDEIIEKMIISLICGGHILLEDMPGTGKTTLAKSLALSSDADFRRIQFTPDLLPTEITGLNFFNQKEGDFVFRKGSAFTNILLADEINRATPRTQSSLLECMEERQISEGGVTYKLDRPFMVIATQNPVETQGTFPLPEAQLDRFFMKLSVGYPSFESEVDMLKKNGYGKDAPAMKAIGYSEFFIENIARDELILKIKNDSHHYAKKQYTFMKGIPGAITVGADDTEKIVSLIMEFIDTL